MSSTYATVSTLVEDPSKPCNAACLHATTRWCRCSCNGTNHGAAHGESAAAQWERGAARARDRAAAAGGAFAYLASRGGVAIDDEPF